MGVKPAPALVRAQIYLYVDISQHGGPVSECQLACVRVLFVSCVRRSSKDGVIVEDDYEIAEPLSE